jgi:hypothetical protein
MGTKSLKLFALDLKNQRTYANFNCPKLPIVYLGYFAMAIDTKNVKKGTKDDPENFLTAQGIVTKG